MPAIEVFEQGFGFVNRLSHEVAADLTADKLAERLDAEANPIGWLLWHVARVQDQMFSSLASEPELWQAEGWDVEFDLAGTTSTGEGHTREEVASVSVGDTDLLRAYADAVHARVVTTLRQLGDRELGDPAPGAPELSKRELTGLILSAITQHCGQAAFVRGIVLRRQMHTDR